MMTARRPHHGDTWETNVFYSLEGIVTPYLSLHYFVPTSSNTQLRVSVHQSLRCKGAIKSLLAALYAKPRASDEHINSPSLPRKYWKQDSKKPVEQRQNNQAKNKRKRTPKNKNKTRPKSTHVYHTISVKPKAFLSKDLVKTSAYCHWDSTWATKCFTLMTNPLKKWRPTSMCFEVEFGNGFEGRCLW